MKLELNKIAELERAIQRKHGAIATKNPSSFWDEEKEAEYLKQLKEQILLEEEDEKIKVDGFLVSKKLFNRGNIQICSSCKKHCLTLNDDLFYVKHEMCEKCFYLYKDGR
tara:strand:- start:179 stop:508 length:330 start_codon:yes stop_codon:yes gene_type:complete